MTRLPDEGPTFDGALPPPPWLDPAEPWLTVNYFDDAVLLRGYLEAVWTWKRLRYQLAWARRVL